MKRIVGMILSVATGVGSANAGSIGGTGAGNASLFYFPNGYSISVPDRLDEYEYIVIVKRGARAESDLKTYSMEARDFDRLLDVADSSLHVNAKGENKTSGSYWVRSGDETNKVKLIDRRAEMRSKVAP